ncbi:methylmalonyl-CoA mutase family protein [Nocardioides limicola]|uniref:methylmalonyl-CoA mutase family protein n=1 Tax=Nocardioides limicola TaxID=2803368 RepID=UPI00193C229E|nr:methylmalonyl-CoA mutase family protein [Nocardioides sp. DJM-14]
MGTAETPRLALASETDRYTAQDWEKATAAVLRKSGRLTENDPDAAVWDALTRTTLDGIAVPPIGAPATVAGLPEPGVPGAAPFTRGRTLRGEWDIRAELSGPDAKTANEAALAELNGGVTSLLVRLGVGLTPADLPQVLDGVRLDLAPVVLETRALDAAERLAAARALLDLTGDNPAEGTNLGADPLTDDVAEVAALASGAGVLGFVIDATTVHDTGASDAQELGWSLAVGAAALRRLVAAGISVDDALGLVEFRYAATPEQFPTIAKLRAARRCWSRVAELSGATAERGGQRQHAVTSRPAQTKYDPWVNMLRGTVGAFAAGVGGADAVTVVPFDAPLGVSDAFARRIARNTSALLIHESHVARVADPAGGAYAVEKLTDDLAAAGWEEFGRIEAAGGIAAGTAVAEFDARVSEVVAVRDRQVATRKRPITGLSEFPNLAERLPERLPAEGDGVRRYGAAFEAMRDNPPSSPVFLATLGPVAAHTARATFAANLFAAGGVAVEVGGPSTVVADVIAAYAGQSVVCLAGTDAAYAEWGADLVAALREAGARHVILAGKPGDKTLAAALVDDSCAMGVDAIAFLTTTREKLA